MTSRRLAGVVAVLLAAGLLHSGSGHRGGPSELSGSAAPGPEVLSAEQAHALSRLPLSFEANTGQAPPHVRFLARAGGYEAQLGAGGAVFTLGDARGVASSVTMELVGGRPNSEVSGLDELPGKVNYIVGPNRADWHTGVATYARVAYEDAYPGIDVVYHGSRAGLEYDFVLAPGADPDLIGVRFAGAEGVRIDGAGDVVVETAAGALRQHRPVAYQDTPGGRLPVESSYVTDGDGTIGLRLGPYDESRVLVVDPVIEASTYLGGRGWDHPTNMAVDASGAVYLLIDAHYTTFPTTAGAWRGASVATAPVVAKLSADLSRLEYATYVSVGGGFGTTLSGLGGIAVDAAGSAYVTGYTEATGSESLLFPTKNALHDCSTDVAFPNSPTSGFLTKLSPDGSDLAYSTCLGTDQGFQTFARDLALDRGGRVWVGGDTISRAFPTTANAYQKDYGGGFGDGFLMQIDTTKAGGASLVYSTYLGGAGDDFVRGVEVDAGQRVHVSGEVGSTGVFPAPLRPCGEKSSYIAMFVPDAGALRLGYATCGIGTIHKARSLAVDSAGNTYALQAQDSATDALVTANAYRKTPVPDDWLITKLDPSGRLVYASYLGISSTDFAGYYNFTLAPDDSGHVYVLGQVTAPFEAKNAPLAAAGKEQEMFLVEIDTTKAGEASLVFSTPIGGSGNDLAADVALGPDGTVYVAGLTYSTDLFPRGPTGLQKTNSGAGDAFVARIVPPPRLASVSAPSGPACGGTTLTLTGTRLGATTKVEFGTTAVAADNIKVLDASRIQVVAPPRPPGSVGITVTAPSGTASIPHTYEEVPVPTVSALNPARGPIEGNTAVRVSGTGLGCVRTVSFGGAPASAVRPVDGGIEAVAPPHARGPVEVVLGADAGDGRSLSSTSGATSRYTYVALPVVSSVLPTCAPAGAATAVAIGGRNLSGATAVRFGSATVVPIANPANPDTSLAAVTPALGEGEVEVTVTTPDGTSELAGARLSVPCPAPALRPGEGVGAGSGGPSNDGRPQDPFSPPGGTGGSGQPSAPAPDAQPGLGQVAAPAADGSAGAALSPNGSGTGGGLTTAGSAPAPLAPGTSPTAGAAPATPAVPAAAPAQAGAAAPAPPPASPSAAAGPGAPPPPAAGSPVPGNGSSLPSPAGAGPDADAELAPRYAMVTRSSPGLAPAAGVAVALMLLLAAMGCCITSHLRRRSDAEPAWARAR